MTRIAYFDECWTGQAGPLPQIELPAPTSADYYYYVEDFNFVLRFFGRDCEGGEPLGEIYTCKGTKVGDVPPFVHPEYWGSRTLYRSQVAWVQAYCGGSLSLVVYCNNPDDFRVNLNLRTLAYSKPEFGVK